MVSNLVLSLTVQVENNKLPHAVSPGSKEKLFYAAVDHGFTQLYAAVAALAAEEATLPNDLEYLRLQVRAFLTASIVRPDLLRLMNREGLEDIKNKIFVFLHPLRG